MDRISGKIREMLMGLTPEFVAAAEDVSNTVRYFPVSALGRSPSMQKNEDGSVSLVIKPKDISPSWATVPLLYAFAKWSSDQVTGVSNGA